MRPRRWFHDARFGLGERLTPGLRSKPIAFVDGQDKDEEPMSEVCFCLWYYISANQKLIGLAARAYCLSGDDDEKGMLLAALAKSDHLTQGRHSVPDRLVRAFSAGVPYQALQQFGVEEVFAEQIVRIKGHLPANLPIPQDKFYFAQPMFDFGFGYVPCEIGDGFIRECEV